MKTKAKIKIKLWVSVISHEHGQNVYIAHDEDSLRDEIYTYLEEWWGDGEFEDDDGHPLSISSFDTHQEAIDYYFDQAREFAIPEYIEYRDVVSLPGDTIDFVMKEHAMQMWESLKAELYKARGDGDNGVQENE